MPFPLLPLVGLAVSALTAGKGGQKIMNARLVIKDAKKRYTDRYAVYQQAEERLKDSHKGVEEGLSTLGKRRLEALVTMGKAVEFLKKAKIKDRDLREHLEITPEKLTAWQGASVKAAEVLGGLTKSVVAGFGTASSIYGLVGLYGAASTGAAISTLGGAAATNATLAWLGGGALASGGGGMALGAMVLNGAIAGPGILAAGFVAGRKAEKVKTEVARQISEMDIAEAQIEQQLAVLRVALRRVDELIQSTNEVDQSLQNLLAASDPSVIEQAYDVARTAKALGELLDVAVTDGAGNLIEN